MSHPQNVVELYAQMPQVVANITGGTNYVHGIEPGDAINAHLPWVMAWFSPFNRTVSVNPAVSKRLQSFFQSTAGQRRGVVASEAAERWELGLVKADLVLLTATLLRGIGPQDEQLMRTEWASLWQFPHGHTVVNGVPEAMATRIVNAVAGELGLTDRDPRLVEVQPLQSRYVAQVALIEAIAGDVAEGRGTSVGAELAGMVRSGSGHLAGWNLARRFAGVEELGGAAALDKLGGWVEIRQAIDGACAGATVDWIQSHEPVDGFDQDQTFADHWARVAARDIRSAARRVRAGPGQSTDVGKFAAGLAAAAAEATAQLATSLDFLQDAWAMAEDVGGVEAQG